MREKNTNQRYECLGDTISFIKKRFAINKGVLYEAIANKAGYTKRTIVGKISKPNGITGDLAILAADAMAELVAKKAFECDQEDWAKVNQIPYPYPLEYYEEYWRGELLDMMAGRQTGEEAAVAVWCGAGIGCTKLDVLAPLLVELGHTSYVGRALQDEIVRAVYRIVTSECGKQDVRPSEKASSPDQIAAPESMEQDAPRAENEASIPSICNALSILVEKERLADKMMKQIIAESAGRYKKSVEKQAQSRTAMLKSLQGYREPMKKRR